MAAVEQNEDLKSNLRLLVPVSALSDEKFAELVAGTRIEEAKAGDTLFVEGDRDARAVYVLAGKVAMMSGKSVVDTVVGGTEHARYPLAHHIPRQVTAMAKNVVSYVRIEAQLLDNLLFTGGQQDAYEVSEVLEEEDSDWMSQMLQSETFANLPAQNIQSLFIRMEEVSVKAGDVILRQGERGDYFYMLRRGRCQVEVEENNKSRVVAELNAGDTFGEESLIAGTLRNATVTMLTDGVLMRLSKDDFDSLMKQPLINWVTFDEATDIVNNGGVWLDVRAPNEYKHSCIAGSHNFPLSVLRSNSERLKPTRKYVIYCDTGKRSSVAAFLLNQRGFDTYVLAGGYTPEKITEAEIESSQEKKPDTTVVDINTRQAAVVTEDAEKTAAQEAAERLAASESERRTQVEAELAELKAKQANASRLAEEEIRKRQKAEEAVAQLQVEQEAARKKAEEEIQKRKEAEEEATRIKREAQAAREKADAELNALREQREQAKQQAAEQAIRLKEEAEAARMIAAEEASRLKEEAEAARKAAEEAAERIRAEASAAKEKAQAEVERLQKEQVEARKKAEGEADRLRAEAARVRAEAEEEARIRSEELASRIVAEAEAARFEVEQEAARLLAEAEAEKLHAEAERASFLSSQEDARLVAEQEVARIRAEAEQARIKAEEEQHKMREVEAARLAAEEEAARLKAEAEAARRQVEEELSQRQAEAEAVRLKAEEEAARVKAEAETTRLRAEEEAARLSAELEAARMDVKNENAEVVVRLEAEAEAARLEAREALRLKEEAETARLEAEQAALKVQEEAEAVRLAAEEEATRLKSDAETTRLQVEEEAQRAKEQAKVARKEAEAEASRLANEVETAREQAERDAQRLQAEAEDAQKRADAMIDKMRAEAESMKQRADKEEKQQQAAKPATPVPVSMDSDLPLEQVTVDEIKPLEGGDDEAEIIVLGEADAEDDFVVVPSGFVDVQDDIEKLINEAADESESVFVSQFTEQVVEPQLASEEKTYRSKLFAGIGVAAVIVVGALGWWLSSGDDAPSSVVSKPEVVTPEPVPAQVVEEAAIAKAPLPKQPSAIEPAAKPPATSQTRPETKPVPAVTHKPVYVRDTLKAGGQAPSMALIPAGRFSMGSPSSSPEFDERPQHEVQLRSFAMSRYEVTVADFRRYVRATGRSGSAVKGRKDNEPVTKVSWLEAVKYTKWLSSQTGRKYRLPTEAEWEYAASAGVGTHYPWGGKIGKNLANCFDCGSKWDRAGPAAVGSFKANRFGLYDVAGNVSEWVQDCANKNYDGAPVDGSAWQRGDCKQRMVRGGAFNSPADSLRLEKRTQYAIDSRLDTIGIRLVRE